MVCDSFMKVFLSHKRRCSFVAIIFAAASLAAGQSTKQRAPIIKTEGPPAYRQALSLLRTGHLTEALKVIRAGLATNPSDWQLYDLQGRAQSALGHSGEAEASFQRAVQLAPQQAEIYADLGILALQTGKEAEALGLFQKALDRDPHNFSAQLGLGTTLLGLKEYEKAVRALKPAWVTDPGNFRAGYEYALALRELKQPKQAQEVLSKLAAPSLPQFAIKCYALSGMVAEDLEDWPNAIQDYSRAYRLAPDEVEVYSFWVRAALKSKNPEAIRALPSPPAGLPIEQRFSLGVLFASVGSYPKAIPQFKATLQADPSNNEAAYDLALSYQQSGQRVEAISVIRTALKQKPAGDLYNLLASLEESTGDYVQAARDFRRAVDLDPGKKEYYFDLGVEYLSHYAFRPALNVFSVADRKFPASLREKVGLGFAHYGLHQYAETEQAFLEAIEIDPSAPGSFAAWGTLTSFLTPGGYQKIAGRLCQLAPKHPSSAEALYYCGVSLFRSGEGMAKASDLDAATVFLQRALRLKPELAGAHLELGELYASRNENNKAVQQFLETVKVDPNSVMGHYQLGQTYRRLGKLNLAQKELFKYSALSQAHRSQLSKDESEIKKFIVAAKPKQR